MKSRLLLIFSLLLPVYGQAQCQAALTGTFTLSGGICPGTIPSSISVSPASTIAADSSTTAYSAISNSSDGSQTDITSSVAWASLSPSIASITSGGVATCGASANGNTLITASLNGLVGVASLTCQPIPIITTLAAAVGTVGNAYTTSFSATGGSLPYSWAVISGCTWDATKSCAPDTPTTGATAWNDISPIMTSFFIPPVINAVGTEPNSGARMVFATDPTHPCDGSHNNSSWVTPSNSAMLAWSPQSAGDVTNSLYYLVVSSAPDAAIVNPCVIKFNRSTMQVVSTTDMTALHLTPYGSFDHATPHIWTAPGNGQAGTTPWKIYTADATNVGGGTTFLVDLSSSANCPNIGALTTTTNGEITQAYAGGRFAYWGNGGQDAANTSWIYDTVKGCMWMDWTTGDINAAAGWGMNTTTCAACIPAAYLGAHVHRSYIDADGLTLTTENNTAGQDALGAIIFTIPSAGAWPAGSAMFAQALIASPQYNSNHKCFYPSGFVINGAGLTASGFGQLSDRIRPNSATNTAGGCSPVTGYCDLADTINVGAIPAGNASHDSCGAANSAVTNLFAEGAYMNGAGTGHVTFPWQQEIDLVSPIPTSQHRYRLLQHHMKSQLGSCTAGLCGAGANGVVCSAGTCTVNTVGPHGFAGGNTSINAYNCTPSSLNNSSITIATAPTTLQFTVTSGWQTGATVSGDCMFDNPAQGAADFYATTLLQQSQDGALIALPDNSERTTPGDANRGGNCAGSKCSQLNIMIVEAGFSTTSGSLPAGSLPDGLTLNNTSPTATITGTPTAVGINSFRLQVTEHGGFTGFRDFSINIQPVLTQAPTLPQRFVDGRESLLSSYTNTAILDNASTWSCHGASKGPYAQTLAGLNSAIVDTEACRAANGDSSKIRIPHGTVISQVFSGSNYVNFKQTGGDASTSPINITSDNPLPTNDPLTTLPRDQRVGTYNIASTSGLVRASGLVTVTGMNPFAAAPTVGDLATIWNPDDKTFAGQYTVCGAPTCSNPTTTAFQYQQPEDLLLWMSSSAANRIANHQTGSGNPHYSYMDADGQKFWLIKGSSGHPWDINTYDGRYIYHWITEDGDSASQAACIGAGFSSCFVDPNAYKRHFTPVPIMPRFLAQGQTFTVDTPTTLTSVARTTNCELAGTTDTVSIGPVRGVAFFTTRAWGGTIGTVTTLENDFLYGISGGIYQNKEILLYVKGLGLIQWQNTHWDGSSYAVVQTTTDTTNAAGGAPTPVFPCSSNLVTNGTWIGGTPGVGGNSSAPTPVADATSQNGIVYSLEAQSAIQQISVSGCTTTGVIGAACVGAVDFLANPNFSVFDRFQIVGSTCVGCITLDQNAFNTTWYVASIAADGNCATCQITFNSYTEFLGNGATATNGTALHFNHIIQDQVACCMYTIETTGGGGGLIFGDSNQYHNYLIANAELRSAVGNTVGVGTLIDIGPNGFVQTPVPPMSVAGCNGSPAQMNCDEPGHVGIDRSYIHGYSFPRVARTVDSITVALQLDCGWCYLTNSVVSDIHNDGQESHAIHVKSGVGPFKIVNDLIEGSSEGIFSSYLPKIAALPNGWFCDWEIRRNFITTNPFEMMNSGGNIPNGTGKYFQYLLKNKVEFKNSCNVLVDGNVIERSSGGQGEQGGTLLGNNSTPGLNGAKSAAQPGSQSHDVTYSNNWLRHAFNGVYYPSRSPGNEPINLSTNHYAWLNDLWTDIGNPTLYARNSWNGKAWTNAYSTIFQVANRGQQYTCSGTQTGGVATLNCAYDAAAFTPSGVCVAPVGQTSCGTGIQAGDWVEVSGCSDPLYNVAAPQQVPSLTSDPVLGNTVISYNVPAAAAGSVSGCILSNPYGYPRFSTVSHNTVVMNYNITNPSYANVYFSKPQTVAAQGSGSGCGVCVEVMARDWQMQNNVFSMQVGPAVTPQFIWCAPNGKDGTLAEGICWDANSLVWTNTALGGYTGLLASKYTEYNAPAGVPGANHGVSPPVTNFMNLANGCASTPDTTCVGFAGNYLNNNCGSLGCNNPANVADFAPLGFDYHQFALQAGSVFAATKAHQASDASDTGVNFTNLDAAFGLQQYPGGNP